MVGGSQTRSPASAPPSAIVPVISCYCIVICEEGPGFWKPRPCATLSGDGPRRRAACLDDGANVEKYSRAPGGPGA